jgi:hypothetical protein
MQPEGAWSDGTDEEMIEAARLNKTVVYAPPPIHKEDFNWRLKELLEELLQLGEHSG